MLAQADRRCAAHDERIEAVEGSRRTVGNGSALGRFGIGIGEMREAFRVERFAMHCDRLGSMDGPCESRRKKRREDQQKKYGPEPEQSGRKQGIFLQICRLAAGRKIGGMLSVKQLSGFFKDFQCLDYAEMRV